MGTICCREEDKMNPFSKKLIQVKPSGPATEPFTTPYKSNNEIIDLCKAIICIYDLEEETGMEDEVNLRVLHELEGLSEVNLNNSLYLCGAGKDDTSGSFLFRVDPHKTSSNNLAILVNSIHHHFLPTLIGYKNDYIIAIGGLNQTSCDIYSIKAEKWKNLPEMPEERFKCSVIEDNTNDYIYLFGGYNHTFKKNCTTILRCNMKALIVWESLLVRHNAALLCRNSCAIFKFASSSVIYILGGKDFEDKLSDQIVEFDLHTRGVTLSNAKLDACASFKNQCGSDLNKSLFCFFDEKNFIHKIVKSDFKVSMVDFQDVSE